MIINHRAVETVRVFIVMHKGFKSTNIVKVFSEKEMAQKAVKDKNENWWIEVYEVDTKG